MTLADSLVLEGSECGEVLAASLRRRYKSRVRVAVGPLQWDGNGFFFLQHGMGATSHRMLSPSWYQRGPHPPSSWRGFIPAGLLMSPSSS